MRRIMNVNHEQSAWGCHVKTMAGSGHECRASQSAARIKSHRLTLFEKVVVWISIHKSADKNIHEPFLAIGHIDVAIENVDRLLFIFGQVISQRIEREGAGQRNTGSVLCMNTGALTQRR